MGRMLYLASLEPGAGKSVAATWLVEVLSRQAGVVGYLRPVVEDPDDDHRLELVAGRFPRESPDGKPLQRSVHTADEVEDAIAEGRKQEIFSAILDAAHDLAASCDVVLVDGTDYTGVSRAFEFDVNAEIATHLGASVVALIAGQERSVDDLVQAVGVAEESLRTAGCAIAATIVNRVAPDLLDEARAAVEAEHEGDSPIFVVPELPLISAPTVKEVIDALDADTMVEGEPGLSQVVERVKVLAMTLENVLARLEDGALVVTPGDRHDIILGTLLAHTSPNHPKITGLVLTGGLAPRRARQGARGGPPGARCPGGARPGRHLRDRGGDRRRACRAAPAPHSQAGRSERPDGHPRRRRGADGVRGADPAQRGHAPDVRAPPAGTGTGRPSPPGAAGGHRPAHRGGGPDPARQGRRGPHAAR